MTPQRLLQHFDRLAEAPDAIPRLRQFILDLAVRGKLVEQVPNDEPASELLKRIEAEKARLIRDGKIRRERPVTPANAFDVEYALKPGWQAARISQILVELQTGPFGSSLHQSDYQKGGIPVINPASIQNERLVPINSMAVGPATLERLATFKLRAGDVVMGRRGEMGRCAVVTERENGWLCGTGSLVLRLPECVFPRFFVTLIGSPFVREYLVGSAVGATMQNLNQGILLNLVIGLPPLAEQHRIVAKVDELMALCDRLEAAQAERESRRNRLVAATHARLADLSTLNSQPSTFFINHLPHLTTRPEHIQQLRQSILNLAVRGQLVPQDSQDEPVTELLRRIDDERAVTAQTDRRADPGAQELLADELCWTVPAIWRWRGMADLALFIDYRGKTPAKSASGIRLITAKNVRRGFINLEPQEFVTKATYNAWMTRGLPRVGDILFTTEAPMGNAAVVRVEEKFGLAQRVINFRLYGGLDSDFVVLQLLSQPFQAILDATATGLTAKGIKAAKLKRLPVAIPPLAEQHRIVSKVEELMALCDHLEAHVRNAQSTRVQLLDATLHTLLGNVPREFSRPIEEQQYSTVND